MGVTGQEGNEAAGTPGEQLSHRTHRACATLPRTGAPRERQSHQAVIVPRIAFQPARRPNTIHYKSARAQHTGITKRRYSVGHAQIAIVLI
ncbi:hypothetical protein Bpla01_33330 [Burkholderia plantarii]|nr:hypothetical protein Bpla01_33330 [Burkholderia plantarii]